MLTMHVLKFNKIFSLIVSLSCGTVYLIVVDFASIGRFRRSLYRIDFSSLLVVD